MQSYIHCEKCRVFNVFTNIFLTKSKNKVILKSYLKSLF